MGIEDYFERRRRMVAQAMEHGLPIPYTGRRRGRSSFRHFRFVGAHRAAAAAEVDDCGDIRIRGRVKMPPNDWDDLYFSAADNHNWKRYRKTRWR